MTRSQSRYQNLIKNNSIIRNRRIFDMKNNDKQEEEFYSADQIETSNNDIYYNCGICDKFNTISEMVLHKHIKKCRNETNFTEDQNNYHTEIQENFTNKNNLYNIFKKKIEENNYSSHNENGDQLLLRNNLENSDYCNISENYFNIKSQEINVKLNNYYEKINDSYIKSNDSIVQEKDCFEESNDSFEKSNDCFEKLNNFSVQTNDCYKKSSDLSKLDDNIIIKLENLVNTNFDSYINEKENDNDGINKISNVKFETSYNDYHNIKKLENKAVINIIKKYNLEKNIRELVFIKKENLNDLVDLNSKENELYSIFNENNFGLKSTIEEKNLESESVSEEKLKFEIFPKKIERLVKDEFYEEDNIHNGLYENYCDNFFGEYQTSLKYNPFESINTDTKQFEFDKNLIIHREVFECKLCDEVFISKLKYEEHLSSDLHVNDYSSNVPYENYLSHKESLSNENYFKFQNVEEINVRNKEDFLCSFCDFVGFNAMSLKTHINAKHCNNMLKCKFCPFEAKFKTRLSYHYTRNHPQIKFPCTICGLVFRALIKLDKHLYQHTATLFKCNLCDFKDKKKCAVLEHCFRKHPGYLFSCPDCNWQTKSLKSYKFHLSEHQSKKCVTCNFTTKSRVTFENHRKSCHIRNKNNQKMQEKQDNISDIKFEDTTHVKYGYKSCNTMDGPQSDVDKPTQEKHVANSLKDLNSEKLSLQSIKPKCSSLSERCEFCTKKVFSSKMATHVEEFHSGVTPYKCHICSNKFETLVCLKSHMDRVHYEYRYHCKFCLRRYTTGKSLGRHVNVNHTNAQKVKKKVVDKKVDAESPSTICSSGDNTAQKTILPSSQVSKIYKCKQCTYSANHLKILGAHYRYHSKLTQYKCTDCLVAYTRKATLCKHIDKVHRPAQKSSNNLRYECGFCDRVFQVKRSYQSHMILHKSGYSHCCNVCKCRFATNQKLLAHMKWHSPKNTYNCSHCQYGTSKIRSYNFHSSSHPNDLKCDRCTFKCSTKFKMDSHSKIHQGERPIDITAKKVGHILCTICDASFVNLKHCKNHIKSAHDKQMDTFQCDCGNTYKSGHSLLRHINVKHRTTNKLPTNSKFPIVVLSPLKLKIKKPVENKYVSPYQCHICNRDMFTSRSLVSHIRIIHKSKALFCQKCGFSTEKMPLLNAHFNEHPEYLKCGKCQRAYNNIYTINKHTSRCH